MRDFFREQGRTRVFAEAYSLYVAGRDPRRTQLRGKRPIYVGKLLDFTCIEVLLTSLLLGALLKSHVPPRLSLTVSPRLFL